VSEPWPDRKRILDLMWEFAGPTVVGAAAELDLWTAMGRDALSAEEVAERLGSDLRATTMVLDAVAAIRFLAKQGDRYSVPDELFPLLSEESPENILSMIRHLSNVRRNWSQLAWVAKAGIPAPRCASIRGPAADRDAFIAAMHAISGPLADGLVAQLAPPSFKHLLDVGGASGTWTLAFLRAVPEARATIFDLPDAIGQARGRLATSEFADRVTLVAGDYFLDDLPGRADFAWLSAIVHQHSRRHNRALFAKVYAALEHGGRIAIRDMVMEPSRIEPVAGALFAINMLTATETGGTFTFDELAEDLAAAGFVGPALRVKDRGMSSVVEATKK